jgi:16S rRNA (cytidine1402-2'-O)-methyltransferase
MSRGQRCVTFPAAVCDRRRNLAAMTGALILVATPIGNMGDLSARAIETLRTADAVACEDTRRTGRLFELAGIPRSSPFMVVNDHNEVRQRAAILARLARGERVAVVTDAGTPGISDPGERLVRAALDAGYAVEVVPGPSAVVAALVASGLPTGRFCFEGFLPRKGRARTERLRALATEARTTVIYESPHRVAETITDLAEACGPTRQVAVAREITKLHEEIWRGRLQEAMAWSTAQAPRGEIAIVLDGAPPAPEATEDEVLAAIDAELAGGATRRDAAAAVAAELGLARRTVYKLVQERAGAAPT